MQRKEQYTLEELYDKLPIPLTELSKRSGKSHGTLTRIRDGEPARKSTINRLLMVFSEIYGIELSTDNVTGFILEGRQQNITEEGEKQPASSPEENTSSTTTSQQKRDYTREEMPADLPEGAIKLIDFIETTGIPASTIGRWVREGKIEAITRDRVSGVGEQKYLIPSEQEKAKQLNEVRTARKAEAAAPEGFTYLSDFCSQHHVPYQAAADLFPRAIHGQKIKVGRRNQPIIGPKGRHDFYVQLHTRADFRTCDDCPHEQEPEWYMPDKEG
jgi:predicted transcriptional regulator